MTSREQFAADYDVPRGTMAQFDAYAALLTDWQTRMNLVGPSTLDDIWGRHFADSAQLLPLAQGVEGPWLDIGSGAGFPGVVVAMLGAGPVHLVDSIAKKCRFLQAVVDELGLQERVFVHNARVEGLQRFEAAVISARACANLAQLFDWGLRFAGPSTRWLLLKGALADDETAAARCTFSFNARLIPSRTDPRGRIIVADSVKRRRS